MNLNKQWLAYVEAVLAGAVVAGLAHVYDVLTARPGAVDWAAVGAAFLVAAVGYLQAALRWMMVPPPAPTPAPPSPITVNVHPAPAPTPMPQDATKRPVGL